MLMTMNHQLRVITLIAVMLTTFVACGGEDNGEPFEVTKEPLKVSAERLELSEDGRGVQLTITTAGHWTISLNTTDWLHVSPTEGKGVRSVEVSAEKNQGEERSGTITVKAGNISRKVVVVQQATTEMKPEEPTTPGANDNNTPNLAKRH